MGIGRRKGLKLWEKNYILTLGVCYFVLFSGIFFALQFSFRQDLQRESERVLESQERFFFILFNMMDGGTGEEKLSQYGKNLKKRGIYISVSREGAAGEVPVVDFLPLSANSSGKIGKDGRHFCFLRDGRKRYAYLERQFTNSWKEKITIAYMEDISGLYRSHRENSIVFVCIASVAALLLAVFFYYGLKRLYRPVSNIAHELKTPLTAIQGYAQYILLGKVGAEDIAYASSQIDREAKYINDLVERILIIGNLRDASISMGAVSTEELEGFVRKQYPSVRVERLTDTWYGDSTLLECLLSNLLSNACRYGRETTVFFSEEGLRICNAGDFPDKRRLRILNSGRAMPAGMTDGKGIGVPLCHEIARLHHGRLQYRNGKEGLKIECQVPFTKICKKDCKKL